MPYGTYSNKIILLVLVFLINYTANASLISKACGPYIYMIEIIGTQLYETNFKLYYKTEHQKSVLFHEAKEMFYVDSYCIRNKKGDYLFLFNESHGGNAVPEDMFGVYDPKEKKLLIKPHWPKASRPKGNEEQVRRIIGYSPLDEEDSFCCTFEQIEQSDK